VLLDHRKWATRGGKAEMQIDLTGDERPFLLHVVWPGGAVDWPLNVTDPGLLPAPDELRDLPAEALIQALASTRPLHEALAEALERVGLEASSPIDLDPLRRYSSTGHLFQRTRRLSAALEELRLRLERPAASVDVLKWRLCGPFGPRSLASGLVREELAETRIEGEAAFFIAELALTLSRVDWTKAATFIALEEVQVIARSELRHLRKLARGASVGDEAVRSYVRRALREARI
jgi:hypothetical protein